MGGGGIGMGIEVGGWENGGWDGVGGVLEDFGLGGNLGEFSIAGVEEMAGVGVSMGKGLEGSNQGYLSVMPGCDESSGASLPVLPVSSGGDLLPGISSTDLNFGSYANFDMGYFDMSGFDIETPETDRHLRVGGGDMNFLSNNEAIQMASSTTNPSLGTTPLSYQQRPSTATSPDQSLPLSPQAATTEASSKSSGDVNMSKAERRAKNTEAARRYRQKRVDQMAELEAKLKESEGEKEALRMKVALLEGETETLKRKLKKARRRRRREDEGSSVEREG